ncbi:DUF1127 domain-containing protein [Granulosicoccus sp. 3-233]|uniref:DUF1127 domain-containing protein n=1 Tax=Granulosicoccus sp. 3-233 TaxID=3417969 RepID=UPI003D33554B
MSIFNKIKNAFVMASEHNGKVRARQELLRMSDRQLADFGFSRELLLDGVSAWPWRAESDEQVAVQSSVNGSAVRPSHARQEIKQAINELSSYSDRELAELGVTRHSIEEAVRYGRPAVEGVFDSSKHAA